MSGRQAITYHSVSTSRKSISKRKTHRLCSPGRFIGILVVACCILDITPLYPDNLTLATVVEIGRLQRDCRFSFTVLTLSYNKATQRLWFSTHIQLLLY